MNNARRKEIALLVKQIDEELKPLITAITDRIEEIRDEEQDYWDNMPENMQYGDKGERSQEAIDSLESAVSEMDGCNFDVVTDSLNEAAQ